MQIESGQQPSSDGSYPKSPNFENSPDIKEKGDLEGDKRNLKMKKGNKSLCELEQERENLKNEYDEEENMEDAVKI